MKYAVLVALAAMSGSIGASAQARVQWVEKRVDPKPSVVLKCTEKGQISQTRADTVARLRSIVDHVNDVEAQISGMLREEGWSVRGDPRDPRARFVLTYHLVYRVPIRFGLDADDAGMTTRVRQDVGGKFESTIPRSSMRFANEQRQAEIRRRGSQFSAARAAEIADLKSWHGKRHPWNGAELRVLGLRRADEFSRARSYTFCRQQHTADFRARWQQRGLGPLGE